MSAGLTWPNNDYGTEMLSFLTHARIRQQVRDQPMDQGLKSRLIEVLLERLNPIRYKIPDDFLEYTHFKRVIHGINRQASPGYPYLLQYTTNEQMFCIGEDGKIPEYICKEYYDMIMERIQDETYDPIRVFIKPEAITKKKYYQHRERLISSVSVIDQLIDHLLFDEKQNIMIGNWDKIPPKVGWTPIVGGWKLVPQVNVQAADKSAWDWTMQGWIVEILLEITLRLCDNPTNNWKNLVCRRYKQLFSDAIFILSNGCMYKQKDKGLMKSGSVMTIMDNSLAQYVMHMRIVLELGLEEGILWSMGDDTLQTRQPKEYFEKLAQYCILKQVDTISEFAGMRFKGMQVTPSYLSKHAYKLLHLDPELKDEVALAYYLLYHRSSNKGKIAKVLSYLREVPTKEWLDLVYDGC
nr:hypothetical protein 2 [Hypera postica associated sobemovirus 1]